MTLIVKVILSHQLPLFFDVLKSIQTSIYNTHLIYAETPHATNALSVLLAELRVCNISGK